MRLIPNLMSRSLLLFTIVITVAVATNVLAQPGKPVGRAPSGEAAAGRTAQPAPALVIPDSAAFMAAFNSLWPLVQPEITVRERVEKRFKRSLKNLKARGVDTTAAHDSLMASIDTTVDYALMRTALVRAKFTTEDVRALATFYRSAVGRKYLEAQQAITDARSVEVDRYVQRLFNSVVTPLMRPKETVKLVPLPQPELDSTQHVPAAVDTTTQQ
jgi:hypothetical protein